MRPVLILQFSPHDPPGHLESFLTARALPYRMRRIDAGDPVPADAAQASGLVLLGSTDSARDEAHLPWLPSTLSLVRAADADRVPVLGHCLGAQLIARAFGAEVIAAPTQESGWQVLAVADAPAAQQWLGQPAGSQIEAFSWHTEMSTVPEGAVQVLAGRYCDNQGFVLRDLHLALQPHLEITAPTVQEWAHRNRAQVEQLVAAGDSPGVQPIEAMLRGIEPRLRAAHALADRLYDRWVQGLRR